MMTDVLLIIIGLMAGGLSGLVGIGGGIIIIPALVLFLGFSQKHAQGTTLAMLAMPVGLLAAATYFKAGYVHLKASLWLALGFVIGAYLSSKFAIKLPDHALARIFGAILLLIAAKLLILGR